MNITREKLKETLRTIVKEESEYQSFFKAALEKAGKSIPSMSDDEKKAFFDKIDAAWDAKGEKNEALVGGQKELDVDGDGDIEADDLADLRAGKKADESINEEKYTVIDPKGNSLGTGLQIQAASMAKKKGGDKAGYFVVPAKNALKARRALEKFKGDFKNPKLKDMMSDLFYENKSVNEGKKAFKLNPQIGKVKYSISSHDGVKKHKDGSDFWDIETFKNKVDLEKAIKNYTSKGFVKESINEAVSVSQVRSTIEKAKKQLIQKWKQKGGYENFGQNELSQMRDRFDYNPYGSSDEKQIAKMLDGFDNWAMNYDGRNESVNEAPEGKKRFMFDFYTDSFQKNTERETNFMATTLESAIKAAEHICKVAGYAYVEIYYKDLFLGSMKKQNGFKFVEGKGYDKFNSAN